MEAFSLTLAFISFAPDPRVRGVTEETCLGEEDGSGRAAGLEGLIRGSELPGGGPLGLRQGLPFGVLAEEGVGVFNININKIKMKVSTRGRGTNGKRTVTQTNEGGDSYGGELRPPGSRTLGSRHRPARARSARCAVRCRTHM